MTATGVKAEEVVQFLESRAELKELRQAIEGLTKLQGMVGGFPQNKLARSHIATGMRIVAAHLKNAVKHGKTFDEIAKRLRSQFRQQNIQTSTFHSIEGNVLTFAENAEKDLKGLTEYAQTELNFVTTHDDNYFMQHEQLFFQSINILLTRIRYLIEGLAKVLMYEQGLYRQTK